MLVLANCEACQTHTAFIDSKTFLSLAVCTPSLFIESIIEIISDISTRFSVGGSKNLLSSLLKKPIALKLAYLHGLSSMLSRENSAAGCPAILPTDSNSSMLNLLPVPDFCLSCKFFTKVEPPDLMSPMTTFMSSSSSSSSSSLSSPLSAAP